MWIDPMDDEPIEEIGTELQYLILKRPATNSIITLYARDDQLVGVYTNNVYEFTDVYYPGWEVEQFR